MKKQLLLASLLTMITCAVFAQTDSLKYKNGFWKGNEKISQSTVKELLNGNNEALALFKEGQSSEIVGYIIGLPSAFIFGYDLGYRMGGGEGNNTRLLISGIGTAVGLIFSFTAESKFKRAVTIYNSNKNKQLSSLNLGITSDGGVGLTLKFQAD